MPLTIRLKVLDTANGSVGRKGAAVYLWHCDIDGRYSLYSEGVTKENYLRGVQETGGDGTVTFASIFPAAYSGRWPHVHFEVYPSLEAATTASGRLRTSQMAFPEAACRQVYATEGYSSRPADGWLCHAERLMSGAGRLPTTNRLMAVLDTDDAAAAATAALAREGLAGDAVLVLRGGRDADRIDSLGNVGGLWARARRLASFTLADQMVDLAVYEAALRDGRTVLSVLAPADDARERAKRALTGAGGHFVNFFGRFATEDIVPWRGRELPLPAWLRR